jgi:hypothetical protein
MRYAGLAADASERGPDGLARVTLNAGKSMTKLFHP